MAEDEVDDGRVSVETSCGEGGPPLDGERVDGLRKRPEEKLGNIATPGATGGVQRRVLGHRVGSVESEENMCLRSFFTRNTYFAKLYQISLTNSLTYDTRVK